MYLLLICSVVVFLAFILYKCIQIQRKFKELPFPGPPPTLVIGHMMDIIKSSSLMVTSSEWLNKYGKVIQVFILNERVIIVGKDIETVKDVFTNKAYIKGIIKQDFEALLGNTNLLFSDGDIWSTMRRTCTGAFHKEQLRIFEDPIHTCVGELVKYFEDRISTPQKQISFDLDNIFSRVTLDILGRTMLSTDFESLQTEDSPITKQVEIYLREAMEKVKNPFIMFFNPMSPIRHNRAVTFLSSYVRNLISLRVQARMANQLSESKDLLDLLLDAENPDTSAKLTTQEIQDQVLTFLIAGHETTAHSLTFTFSCLARHPHIVEKLCAELDEVLGKDQDAIPSFEQCQKLIYTGACIKEAMRMFPIAPNIIRQLDEPRTIDGVVVPKGDLVLVNMVSIHYNPETWKNPGIYEPERFLPKDGVDPPTLLAHEYAPFGHGKRACIGQHFAMLEMKMILAKIIRKFRFQHVALESFSYVETVTCKPGGGLHMTVWKD